MLKYCHHYTSFYWLNLMIQSYSNIFYWVKYAADFVRSDLPVYNYVRPTIHRTQCRSLWRTPWRSPLIQLDQSVSAADWWTVCCSAADFRWKSSRKSSADNVCCGLPWWTFSDTGIVQRENNPPQIMLRTMSTTFRLCPSNFVEFSFTRDSFPCKFGTFVWQYKSRT